MYSNGTVDHGEQAKIPMPPALTQRVRPAGGDGSSLPLEPFLYLRGRPVNRVAFATIDTNLEPEGAEDALFPDEPLPLDEPLDLAEPLHLEEPLLLDEPLQLAEPFQLSEPLQLADSILAEDAAAAPPVADLAAQNDALQPRETPSRSTTTTDADVMNAAEAKRDLAERLEQLSRRLRDEQLESLLPSLASGDRFDALVAGFLAGYFSAKDAGSESR